MLYFDNDTLKDSTGRKMNIQQNPRCCYAMQTRSTCRCLDSGGETAIYCDITIQGSLHSKTQRTIQLEIAPT